MRLKTIFLSFIAVLGLCLLFTPVKDAYAEEIIEKPTILFFDENDNQIFPYSEEEIEQMFQEHQDKQDIIPFADWSIYSFGRTTFRNNIWIGGGSSTVFYNPGTIHLESAQETNPITVNAYTGGNKAGSVYINGGWIGGVHIPFTHLARGKSYSFELVNESTYTAVFDKGQVWYNGK